QGEGNESADLRGGGDDVLRELGIALLRHGAAAHRAGRHRLLHLAELLLHQRVDLASDLAARGREHAEEHDVLRLVIADGTGGHGHGFHAEVGGHSLLRAEPEVAEGGEGARAAPQHGHEHARLAPRRRSTCRPSASIHTATLKPKVAGTACWPCVRPGRSTSLVWSARSASVPSSVPSWRKKISCARRTCRS